MRRLRGVDGGAVWEYLGLLLAVLILVGALLAVTERRASRHPPIRPVPLLMKALGGERAAPRPRPPARPRAPRRPPAPGPTVRVPRWLATLSAGIDRRPGGAPGSSIWSGARGGVASAGVA